jgi:ribosome maturation factor RimP
VDNAVQALDIPHDGCSSSFGACTHFGPTDYRILLLPCTRNILFFRSEAGRTVSGRKPTFLLPPVAVHAGRVCSGSLRVILDKIRDAAERVARSEGLEIVDVEWKVGRERFLRVYIDRVPDLASLPANGHSAEGQTEGAADGATTAVARQPYAKISHSDCERVSQQLSVILDVEDLIPGAAGYTLEVSSPGMDRALTKPEHFTRFAGRLAKITTSEPLGEAKFFEGRLAGFTDGNVHMALKGKEARTVEIPLLMIRKANLVVEF